MEPISTTFVAVWIFATSIFGLTPVILLEEAKIDQMLNSGHVVEMKIDHK